MIANYIRVSTLEQNTARQELALNNGCLTFVDKCSGSIPFAERPQAAKLLNAVLSGKITEVRVKELDRLGRKHFDIMQTIETIRKTGCQLFIEKMSLYMLDSEGKENFIFNMVVAVMANLANQELNNIKERQAEGIAIAKIEGSYNKRKPRGSVPVQKKLEKHSDIVELLRDGKSIRKTATLTKKSVGTVNSIKKLLDANSEMETNEENEQ